MPPPRRPMRLRAAARAVQLLGPDAEGSWTDDDALAWEGLFELSRRLRRQAEDVLSRDEDRSVSMFGIMGRLVRSPHMALRRTVLTEATGLSISRVPRIVDMLVARELVERHACPTDARGTNITATLRGRERTARAQHRLFEFVQQAFAGRLTPDEMATLARVFARLLATAPGAGVRRTHRRARTARTISEVAAALARRKVDGAISIQATVEIVAADAPAGERRGMRNSGRDAGRPSGGLLRSGYPARTTPRNSARSAVMPVDAPQTARARGPAAIMWSQAAIPESPTATSLTASVVWYACDCASRSTENRFQMPVTISNANPAHRIRVS